MNIKDAKRIAFGSAPSVSLEQYYGAWQWLYDNEIELLEPDVGFLDKLICDGLVKAREDYTYNG